MGSKTLPNFGIYKQNKILGKFLEGYLEMCQSQKIMNEITKAQWQWYRNKTKLVLVFIKMCILNYLSNDYPRKSLNMGVKGAANSSSNLRLMQLSFFL